MDINFSGLTASSQIHPEIIVGNVFRNKYGGTTSTIKARAYIQKKQNITSAWRTEK